MKFLPLLLITGTVGVGKSHVADEVFEILKAQSKPVALIHLDELGYAYPKPQDDQLHLRLRLKNLAAIWPNYREVGVRAFIVPYAIESRDILERFRDVLPDADIFIIRLDAPLSVLEKRIRNRSMGGDKEWHIKRAAELAAILEQAGVEDATVDTEHKTITEVAQDVIANWTVVVNKKAS